MSESHTSGLLSSVPSISSLRCSWFSFSHSFSVPASLPRNQSFRLVLWKTYLGWDKFLVFFGPSLFAYLKFFLWLHRKEKIMKNGKENFVFSSVICFEVPTFFFLICYCFEVLFIVLMQSFSFLRCRMYYLNDCVSLSEMEILFCVPKTVQRLK